MMNTWQSDQINLVQLQKAAVVLKCDGSQVVMLTFQTIEWFTHPTQQTCSLGALRGPTLWGSHVPWIS